MISERSVELGRFLRHYSVPLAHLIGEEVKTGEGKGFVPSSYSKQNLTGAWASWWVLSSMCLSCSTGQVCLSQSKNRPRPPHTWRSWESRNMHVYVHVCWGLFSGMLLQPLFVKAHFVFIFPQDLIVSLFFSSIPGAQEGSCSLPPLFGWHF